MLRTNSIPVLGLLLSRADSDLALKIRWDWETRHAGRRSRYARSQAAVFHGQSRGLTGFTPQLKQFYEDRLRFISGTAADFAY
jgi:hypothetical protein